MTREGCVIHQDLAYEAEIALVRELVDSGDRAHALHHCTSALVLEPHRTEWRTVLCDLLRDRALVHKLEHDQYFGSHAARAYHLHETGELLEAIGVISQVHAAVPHVGFLDWFTAWADKAVASGLTIDAGPFFDVLLLGYSFGVGRMRMLPAEAAAAEQLVPVARMAMTMTYDDKIALMASAIMRRAGRYDEAVEAAERARGSSQPEMYLIAKALALRGKRDFDGALRTFDEARRATGDPTHLAERVRVLADAGRWAEALDEWNEMSESHDTSAENAAEYAELERAALANAPPPEAPPLDLVRRRVLGH